jgi:hypothetical protein
MKNQWRSWLRQCATIREDPGLFPGTALGNFQVTYSLSVRI